MKKEKKLILIFAVILVFLTAMNSAFAIVEGPNCEIIEKPKNFDVTCSPEHLILLTSLYEADKDRIEKIEVTEAPFLKDSELFLEFQQEINQSIAYDKQNGLTTHRINLKELGKYAFKINDEYFIELSYGEDYLKTLEAEQKLMSSLESTTNIGVILGVTLMVVGSALHFFKKERIWAILLIVGFGLLVVMLAIYVVTRIIAI